MRAAATIAASRSGGAAPALPLAASFGFEPARVGAPARVLAPVFGVESARVLAVALLLLTAAPVHHWTLFTTAA
ncbi:hypothetical protein [Ruania zhangjianzhongii]|uniref:hypothetical protein n=1 Tax=Ruania zhangjianzhongii TaxID=2603206 RepID=UPI00143DA60B|nr:hypothetical protein [Ruania zhangjianzhongii]